MRLQPAWSSPAERQQWEKRLDERLDKLAQAAPAPPSPKPRRALPARRSLPAPRPSRLYARVSDALGRDGRLSASAIKLGLELVKTARGRSSVDGFIDYWAERIGRSRRMTQYAQNELDAAGYIRVERVREGSLNEANVYHLLAPLLAPPPLPRRRPSRRAPMGVQHFAPHEGVSEKPLSSELVAAREGLSGPSPASAPDQAFAQRAGPAPVPRGALGPRGQKATPAAAAPASRPSRARQGASAISPRAPP